MKTLSHLRSLCRPAFARTTIFAIAFAAIGCAFGREYDYRSPVIEPPVAGSAIVAIAVHDQRPEVVSGERDPDYVGVQRAIIGNPYGVTTESGEPLADDWAYVVERSLREGGFTTKIVPTAATDSQQAVLGRLMAARAHVALLFSIRQWEADTHVRTTLHRDVVLDALGPNGAVLAETRLSGDADLGGDLESPNHAEAAVPVAFGSALRRLLGEPRIGEALRMSTSRPGGQIQARR